MHPSTSSKAVLLWDLFGKRISCWLSSFGLGGCLRGNIGSLSYCANVACLSLSLCILSGCDMFEVGPITEAQTEGMTTPTNLEKQLQFQPPVRCYHTVFFNYTNKMNTV